MFLGTQAVAAPIWGLVTQYAGLRSALLAAGVLLVASVLLGLVLRVPDSQALDRSPLACWDTPRLQVDPSTSSGPVVVSIQYQVTDADRGAMRAMRRSRLRSGRGGTCSGSGGTRTATSNNSNCHRGRSMNASTKDG